MGVVMSVDTSTYFSTKTRFRGVLEREQMRLGVMGRGRVWMRCG